MKNSFARRATLPILLCFTALAAAAAAQTADTPPIKMGLWQTEVNSTIAGMENMPQGRAGTSGHRTVSQGCLTPETWKSEMEKLSDEQHRAECKMSNLHQDSHGVSFDEGCTSQRYNSTLHFEAVFDGDDHLHGSAKAHVTAQGMPQGMDMQMTMTSHFVSASCGDVKPGDSKVIHE
jgi:hypothetical protein